MNVQPRFAGPLAALICAGFISVTGWLAMHPDYELSRSGTILVSLLGAAFTTIVNFIWGSSQGSRDKDVRASQPPFILENPSIPSIPQIDEEKKS